MKIKNTHLFSAVILAFLIASSLLTVLPVYAVTPWLTKTALITNLKDLCDAHSTIASYESIGTTVDRNDIWMFTLGTNTGAKILIDGTTHGMEIGGAHAIYFLAQWLLGGSTDANNVLRHLQVLLVPIVNYDRYNNTGSPLWRKNNATPYGVDLNRNHISGWNQTWYNETSDYYVGPSAASEPETQVMNTLFATELPQVYINIHDYGGANNSGVYGDFRYPSYVSSAYNASCTALYDEYVSVADGMSISEHSLTPATYARGYCIDDGKNSGETLAYLWEETTYPGESINYDLINTTKWQHLEAFVIATTNLYGVPILSDGFESGNFSAWTGNTTTAGETAAIDSTYKHAGSYSAKFTSNGGGGTEKAYVYENMAISVSELYARTYIYVSASGIDSTDDRFYAIDFKAGSDRIAAVGWKNNSNVLKWTLLIRDGASNIVNYSSASPSLNTWYCVELHWKKDNSAGLGELWVDGTSVATITDKNTTAYGDITIVRVGLAETSNCGSTILYADSVVMTDWAYIGPETAPPTYLFSDGFESGDFSVWTSTTGSPTVQSTTKHDGTYALEADASAKSCYLTVSETTVFFRAYVYISSASGSVEVIRYRAGSTNIVSIYRTTGGYFQMVYRDGGSLQYDTSATAFTLGSWQCIELETVIGSGTGLVKMWVNGTEITDVTHAGITNNDLGSITRINLGCTYASRTVDVFADTAVRNDSYIGPE